MTPGVLLVGAGAAEMVTGLSTEAYELWGSASSGEDDSPELSGDELALDELDLPADGRGECAAPDDAEATVPVICRSRSLAMALTWSQSARCGVKAR